MIFEEIRDLIVSRTNLSESVVTMQANPKGGLGLDSFDLAELGMELEDALTITVSDEELIAFHTVRDVITFMKNNRE